jgi:hypothetical protein
VILTFLALLSRSLSDCSNWNSISTPSRSLPHFCDYSVKLSKAMTPPFLFRGKDLHKRSCVPWDDR